jgi:hypothetical protein
MSECSASSGVVEAGGPGADGFVVGEVGAEKGFEKLAVIRDFQVQEFVDNDVLAERGGLSHEVEVK